MIMAMPRTKSSSMARPAVTDLAPPNNFILCSPVAIRGRMSLFASSLAARVRASCRERPCHCRQNPGNRRRNWVGGAATWGYSRTMTRCETVRFKPTADRQHGEESAMRHQYATLWIWLFLLPLALDYKAPDANVGHFVQFVFVIPVIAAGLALAL